MKWAARGVDSLCEGSAVHTTSHSSDLMLSCAAAVDWGTPAIATAEPAARNARRSTSALHRSVGVAALRWTRPGTRRALPAHTKQELDGRAGI